MTRPNRLASRTVTMRSQISTANSWTRNQNDIGQRASGGPLAECAATLQRPDQGDLVGVLEVPADRDAPRDAGHAADLAREALVEVHRGGLALERGVGGEDHLGEGRGR